MPEVISDTSPLQYLYQAECLDLLPTLYRAVVVPEGVGWLPFEREALGRASAVEALVRRTLGGSDR